MYQRLGNLYTGQRIGSFESDGNGLGGLRLRGKRNRIPGLRARNLDKMPVEALADKLVRKEAALVQLQQKVASGQAGVNATRRLARMEKKAARIREALASRKNVDMLQGLGDIPVIGSLCSPMGLGAVALAAGAGYWFLVRPRLARRRKRNRRK